MMKKIFCLVAVLSLLSVRSLCAVTAGNVQPTIMVVPFVKEGEDVRKVLEDDVNKRVVLTAIKDAFDQREFSTVDFLAKLKSFSRDAAIARHDAQQTDIKKEIIQNSGADIYVDAEIDCTPSSAGNSVKVILTAYDTSTGTSLANKIGESGRFYTDDWGKLGATAVRKVMEDFLNTMQTKFDDIVENGRPIKINIGFSRTSPVLASTEVGKDQLPLSDAIEVWMEENAYKGYYHIQGVSDRTIVYDEVKIPLRDESGKVFNINKFSLKFYMFLKKLGLDVKRTTEGNSLNITIG